ncbi:MAG: hypothetical protein IJQ89_05180 [Bacteroidales bacterium]|nr:hypothetical protein [Bacteroidales bacterium]
MKKLKTTAAVFAAATVVLFAVSCAKEYLDISKTNIIGVKRTINATAALPQGGDKAYLDYADGRKVKWEQTDALNINGTNVALSGLSADNTTASFTSTIHAISSGGNDIYWAVYPAALAGVSSGSSIHNDYTASALTVNFPSKQTYNSSANALSGNTLMAGYANVPAGTERVVFQMRNLGTVLKLTLKADASASNKLVTKIVFTSSGKLAGKFTTNTAFSTITPDNTATTELTVHLKSGNNNYIDIATQKDVYVILPPLVGQTLTMRIYNQYNGWTERVANSTALLRNHIYTNTISNVAFEKTGFSVSDSTMVLFSPGNLQWSATGGGTTSTTHTVAGGGIAPGTWRFAENQWDFVGDSTYGKVYANGVKCDNALISSSYTGWIDLFGWATSGWDNTAIDHDALNFQPWAITNYNTGNTNNRFRYGPSLTMTDITLEGTSANYDWGVYNAIYNPQTQTTDAPGTWRMLSANEWSYVLRIRGLTDGSAPASTVCGTASARYVRARIHGCNGLILFPDYYVHPAGIELVDINAATSSFVANTLTDAQWAQMENAGCVFLPAAGYRVSTSVTSHILGYWTITTIRSSWDAYSFTVAANIFDFSNGSFRYVGKSLRLAKEIN